MRELTHTEAKERAEQLAMPISDMVQPRHVADGAETWEEVPEETLRAELNRSVDVTLQELGHHDALRQVLYERALTHHRENLMRVPLRDLTDSGRNDIGVHYWPYSWDYGDIRRVLMSRYTTLRDLPQEDYHAAREAVAAGLWEGMKPEGVDL